MTTPVTLALPPTVVISPTGVQGPRGNATLGGTGTPTASIGIDGDYYIDKTNYPTAVVLYGPKTAGAWPGSGVTLTAVPAAASTVTAETAFGQATTVGTATAYARSDHTHGTPTLPTASTSIPGVVQLDGTASDIQPLGVQAAGATGKAADAGHVHPTGAQLAKTATTTVTNSSAETVLHTLTVPASDAVAGSAYAIKAFGQATWPVTTAPTITLRLRIGGLAGATVASVTIACPSTAGSGKGWICNADITLTAIGASANWRGSLGMIDSIATAVQDKADTSGAGVTLTSLSAQDLVITAQWSAAAAGNTLTCTGGYAYKIR